MLAGITKRFAVIVADSPWRFGTRSPKGDRRKAPYGTLPTKEICRLIPPAATKAGLFFWALPHMSADAHEVIKEWGFGDQPKSKLYWFKRPEVLPEGERALGKGYWAREDQVEEFWICTRGSFVAPLPGTQFKQGWIAEARGPHSRKPDWFYEEIERLYPDEDKLEMFARPPFRPGWWVWGDEVPGGLMYVPPLPVDAAA